MAEAMIIAVSTPIMLFDGVCNLCNGWVRFVIFATRPAFSVSPRCKRLRSGDHRGTCAQGSGRRYHQLSTIILIEDDASLTESDPVLQILARLGSPWSWSTILRVVPKKECAIVAIDSLHGIATNGSGEPTPGGFLRQTYGQGLSSKRVVRRKHGRTERCRLGLGAARSGNVLAPG